MHEATAPTSVYPVSLPANWWLRNRRYFLYMVRELTAVFAAVWVLLFVTQLPQMVGGPERHAMWLATIRSPGWLTFSLVSLAFAVYNSWTTFGAMGSVVYLRLGGKPVPGSSIRALMFLGWAAATLLIAFVLATPGIGG